MVKAVVALDIGEEADNIIERAKDIVPEGGCVFLINIIHRDPDIPGQDTKVLKAEKAKAKKFISSIEKLLQKDGYVVTSTVRIGIPHTMICEYAHEVNANMVIIGAGKGKDGSHKLGEVSRKVLGLCRKPILIIH